MITDPGGKASIISQSLFNGPMCNVNNVMQLSGCEQFLAGNVSLFNLLISCVLEERQSVEGGRGGMIAPSFSHSVLCHHSVPQWNFKLS